jgi:hypothetical protein
MGTATSRHCDGQQQHAGDDDRAEPGEQRIDGTQPELGRQRRHRGERNHILVEILGVGVELVEFVDLVEGVLDAIVGAPAGHDVVRSSRCEVELGPLVVIDPSRGELAECCLSLSCLDVLGRNGPGDAV